MSTLLTELLHFHCCTPVLLARPFFWHDSSTLHYVARNRGQTQAPALCAGELHFDGRHHAFQCSLGTVPGMRQCLLVGAVGSVRCCTLRSPVTAVSVLIHFSTTATATGADAAGRTASARPTRLQLSQWLQRTSTSSSTCSEAWQDISLLWSFLLDSQATQVGRQCRQHIRKVATVTSHGRLCLANKSSRHDHGTTTHNPC